VITCEECIQRMKPDNPRVRSGRYNKCGCDYCDKPSYYRTVESRITEPDRVEYVTYQNVDGKQLASLRKNLTIYLDEKFNNLKNTRMVDKQKRGRYKEYK